MNDIDARLAELKIELPAPAAPVAAYVPFVQTGNLVFISGQISLTASGLIKGRLGETMTIEEGYHAARACGLQLLAQLRVALQGDLTRVTRVLKLCAFVTATPEFQDHPKVANGASELMAAVFGEKGKHARAAVGVPSLPLGAAVEVDGIFEIV
jgi:enamine deaminase RidA (YjgF/YER057c/UK114 family)